MDIDVSEGVSWSNGRKDCIDIDSCLINSCGENLALNC